MKYLIDTHILLWAANAPDRLPSKAKSILEDPSTAPVYSVGSLWEIVIKSSLGREDFRVDAALLRQGLLDNGWIEWPILAPHVLSLKTLPPIHRDPFDRLFVAQANYEAVPLLTADSALEPYGPVVDLC